LPQRARSHEPLVFPLGCASPHHLGRLRDMARTHGRRDRMVTSVRPGTPWMGACDPLRRRSAPARLDVRADLLSPAGSARTRFGSVRSSLRPPRPMVDGRHSPRAGHPFPAVRATGRGALVHRRPRSEEDALRGGGSAGRCRCGPSSRRAHVRARPARRGNRERKHSLLRQDRALGDTHLRLCRRPALPRVAARSRSLVVVVGRSSHRPPRPCRSCRSLLSRLLFAWSSKQICSRITSWH